MQTEFEFIRKIKNRYNLSKIGDDAAVLPKDMKSDLVITADLLIEDIDFRTKWARPEFIGHKSLAVSISDVIAMGAEPVWSMVSLGIPEVVWKTDFVERFYDGYMRLAEKFKIELIGGDVSKSPDKIVVDSIVAGEVKKGKAILRSTARAGDQIFVTGQLGGAGIGLLLLEHGVRYETAPTKWQKNLIRRQLRPVPATTVNFREIATSMIDISDGLSSDLGHICHASGVGARIFANRIPLDENFSKLSPGELLQISSENLDILNFALHGGEDFELLFTTCPEILHTF